MTSFVVIGAGGTAGHIFPAVAISERLVDLGITSGSIAFVTSTRAVEDDVFRNLEYERIALKLQGVRLKRPWSLVRFSVQIATSFWQVRRFLKEKNASVVLVFGGYVSVVVSFAARSLGIPIVAVETNAVMGKANVIASKIARKTYRAFVKDGQSAFKSSSVPLRKCVLDLVPTAGLREELLLKLGFNPANLDRFIVVFGGSLGSRRINEAITQYLTNVSNTSGKTWGFYVVTGSRDAPMFKARLEALKANKALQVAFCRYDDDLNVALGICDLVICRSGSNTIAELDHFSTPAVLVPLPNSPKDHQMLNARWYVDQGHAAIIADDLCSANVLGKAIDEQISRQSSFLSRIGTKNYKEKLDYDSAQLFATEIFDLYLS